MILLQRLADELRTTESLRIGRRRVTGYDCEAYDREAFVVRRLVNFT